MSAPDPKVVALLAEHIFHEEFGGCTCNDPEVGYDPDGWVAHVAEVLTPAVEHIVAARVAAVVEPALALADWCDTKGMAVRAVGVMIRRRVESSDAPAALARVKAEAAIKALYEVGAWCGECSLDHADDPVCCNLPERVRSLVRIEAEAGDPS